MRTWMVLLASAHARRCPLANAATATATTSEASCAEGTCMYAYVSIRQRIRQHTSRCNSHRNDLRAFVRRRHLHSSAYVRIRQLLLRYFLFFATRIWCPQRQHTSAYVSIRRAPKAPASGANSVSIRQHTSRIRQHPSCAEGTCIWCQQRQHTSAYVAHTSASVVRRRHLHLVPTAPLPHSIRQHTSAYTSAYVSTCIWCQQRHCRIAYVCIRQRIRQHTSAPASGANSATAACRGRSLETADTCHPPAAPASIRQHTQHTSAYVSIRQHTSA
jgi:hypothetical protein